MLLKDESTRPWADRAAMGLSTLCAIHCLLLPVLVTLLPAIAGVGLDDEAFHVWMVVLVLPVSVYALVSGCRVHKRLSVLLLGLAGLLVLLAAIILGHAVLGDIGERAATLFGALLVAFSHLRNYRLCQTDASCECDD